MLLMLMVLMMLMMMIMVMLMIMMIMMMMIVVVIVMTVMMMMMMMMIMIMMMIHETGSSSNSIYHHTNHRVRVKTASMPTRASIVRDSRESRPSLWTIRWDGHCPSCCLGDLSPNTSYYRDYSTSANTWSDGYSSVG
jgi:ABC-type multidrug transport system fused ATPase/permease subunit